MRMREPVTPTDVTLLAVSVRFSGDLGGTRGFPPALPVRPHREIFSISTGCLTGLASRLIATGKQVKNHAP
jgi:hypothetical protein